MNKIGINKIIVDKNKFQHFLDGDGEYWWDDEYGALITKEAGEKILKNWETGEEEDTADLMRECHLYDSYDSLVEDYEYYNEDGAIDYVEVGEKVVLIIVQTNL